MLEPNDHHDRVVESNIARLLASSDRPPEPSALASARWRQAMLNELPRVVRRERARRLQLRFAPLAAAVLLAITLGLLFVQDRVVPETRGEFRVAARSGSPEWRSAGQIAWAPLGNIESLQVGDELLVSPGEIELLSSRRERFAFTDGQIEVEGTGLRLERGSGEWETPDGVFATLATPLLTIQATESRVRIRVEELSSLVPREGDSGFPGKSESGSRDHGLTEGSDMNGKLIGAGLGIALIVTVIVLSTGDDPVELIHNGESTTLEEGDSATVASGVGTTVTRGEDALAGTDASARERADVVEGLESFTDTSLRDLSILVLDLEGVPVENATIALVEGDTPLADALEADGREIRRGGTDAEGVATLRVPTDWSGWTATATAVRYGSQVASWSVESALANEADVPEGDPAPEPSVATSPGSSKENAWVITIPYETSILAQVVDAATGEPILGSLTALQRDVGPNGWSDPVIRASEEEDGSFYFGGLKPGTYWLWSYKDGYARSDRWTVPVAEGERVVGEVIALSPGIEAKFTVFEKSTGKPVSGAVVYPHLDHLPGTVDFPHRSREYDKRARNIGTSGANGIVVLRDLPERQTLIRVLHPDYRIVDLEVDARVGGLISFDVALEKGPSIRGEVIDSDGKAVNDAEVYAVTMTMNREKAEVLAGEVVDGRYEIQNVNSGRFVVVFGAGSEMQMQFSQVVADKDTIVDFIEVAELATLRGRILDHDEQPVGRSFVTVSTVDDLGEVSFRSSTTEVDGTFEIRNLALTEWAVAVSNSPESMVTIGVVNLEQPIDYEEEFSVPSGGIVGTIRADDGAENIRVELFIMKVVEGGLDWRGRCEALPDGTFQFQGLEKGTYRVFAQGLGYRQTTSSDIEVGEGESSTEMTISPGGTVRVLVTDSQGLPVTDLGVRIYGTQSYALNEGLPARTNAQGEYIFPSLGPGDFRVTLHREGVPVGSEKGFTAKMGETVEVRISIP